VQDVAGHFRSQPAAAGDPAAAPDLSGVLRAGRVHQVYAFTEEWVRGEASADPAAPTLEWLAPVVRGSDVLGTVRVWKPDGAAAEVAGFDGDTRLAAALQGFEDLPIVEDPSVAEYFALDGDSVLPVNEAAARELPDRADVADFQPVVAARVAAAVRAAAGAPDAVGGGAPVAGGSPSGPTTGTGRSFPGGGLLVALGAAAVVLFRARRARPVRSPVGTGPQDPA
jgi:hypothetical protein